jgi:hypothetical protein
MKLKNIGFILFVIGILYMFIDGWLISWWLVPDYRSAGQDFFSGTSFYSSESFFTFWALSVPLGSIITLLGLAVYSLIERRRILIFIVLSIIFLAWLALWSQSIVYPALYGIGGGLILFSFSVSIWTLIKTRMNKPAELRTVLDLRIMGYVLLVITAWGMCGLLGIPSFGLRPEDLLKHDTVSMLISMGSKVLICFTLGWILIAISQALEYNSYKKAV